ncbi:hypothetical protein LCGC14_0914180, partial [marine sediment metagenome]
MTREFDAFPEESKIKDVWDTLRVATTNLWHGGKQAILNYLPDLAFPDMSAAGKGGVRTGPKAVQGEPDYARSQHFSATLELNKALRDEFRVRYAQNAAEHQEWVEAHPELQNRKEWEIDQWNAGLLADPFYWANEFAKTAPYSIASIAVMATVGAATGNPLAAVAASTAFVALVEIEDIREALIEAGAPEDDAKLWAIPIAIAVGALESAGHLPMMHALAPRVFRLFRKEITNEVVKRSLPKLLLGAGVAFLGVEAGEIITENLQAATIAAGQKIWDENQPLFENVFETTIQTAVATAPFAVIGGGSAMRRVAPSRTVGQSDIELEAQGFERDAETGQWFERADLPEGVGDNKGLLSMTPEQIIESVGEAVPEVVARELGIARAIEGDAGIVAAEVTPAVPEVVARELGVAPVEAPAVPPTPPVVPSVVGEVAPEGAGEAAVKRVKARISFKPRKPGITERLSGVRNRLMAGWINDRAGLDRVISQAKKGGLNVSMEENPAIQAQLLKGVIGKAASFMEQGTFGRRYWRVRGGRTEANITGESLTTILKDVPSNADLENFSTYLVAQRTVELGGRGIGTEEEIADAKLGVTTLEASNPHFPALADRLFQYQDRLLVYSEESGLIDKTLLAKFRSANGKYVPFFRVFEELQSKGFMGKKMANIAVPFKRIRGSERDIINPLESIVKNTFAIISAADRNMVGVQLANLIDQSPEIAEVFERVPTPMAKVAQVSAKSLGIDIEGLSEADIDRVIDIFRPSFAVAGDQVTVLVNGRKRYFRTDAFLRNALLNLNTTPSDMGIIGTILSAPAKWLRAGALLSPDFMVRNPARDQLTAFVYSKYGYLPGIDFTKGVAGMLGTSPEYQLYKISGAEHATLVSVDRDYLSQSFKSVLRQKRVTKYVKTPIELLQIGRDLSETATRLGAAKRAIAAGASGPEVGYTGRNISLDFEKAGSYARVINQYIPFFTAAIRGNAMMIEMFKSNPVRTSLRVFMSITLPSIALYMINRDEEWYKETPQWQKDLFWLFKVGDTIVRLPKPFELGILFGSTIERFLEYVDTQDLSKLTGVAKSVIEAGTPGFMPQAALPIIENLTNFSFFRGQKIVPTSREADPPELQYTQYTSQVSRKLGELLKLSPAKIDNLIAGWTGGLGRYAVDILDGLLKATGISPDIPEPSRTLADTPVVKAFVVRSPVGSSGNTVNEFYDLLEEYTEGENFLKAMLEAGAQNRYEDFKSKHPELLFFSDFDRDVFYSASARYLRKVARELAEIRKKEDAVFDDPDMSPSEKRRLIDRMERLKTEVARRALALFPGEDPAVLQHEISETVNMLGDVVDEVPELSLEDPEIHDTPALSADLGQILVGITPEDLEGMKGIPKEAPAWFEKEKSEAEQLSFPNTQIYKINADPSKGTTFELYHDQWQRQQ